MSDTRLRPISPDGLRMDRRVGLRTWRRVREYAVPRWMIAEVTERRLTGDVAGACAAAGVVLAFDPASVAARYGAAVAEAVGGDLRHLAPDLLRWYAPRGVSSAALKPGVVGALTRYGGTGGGPALLMRLPDTADEPQRIRLSVEPAPVDEYHPTIDLPRAYWDVRHTEELRELCGGHGDRIPFFHPDGSRLDYEELPEGPGSADLVAHVEWLTLLWDHGRVIEALELCGISPQGTAEEIEPNMPPVAVERLAAEVRAELGPGRPGEVEVRAPFPARPAMVRVRKSGEVVLWRTPRSGRAAPRGLSEYRWGRPIDFDLLRFGALQPDDLHPLVHRALFPAREQRADGGPPHPARPRLPIRMFCGGEMHTVSVERGRLRVPHLAEEVQRELVMLGFGATLSGCFQAVHAWTTGSGPLRSELKALRDDLFERALQGDTPGVLGLLDAGFDPAVRARGGRTLLHFLPHLDHRVLLPRLVAAGLDLDARDEKGVTPLMVAARSPELVDSLLAAGATPVPPEDI